MAIASPVWAHKIFNTADSDSELNRNINLESTLSISAYQETTSVSNLHKHIPNLKHVHPQQQQLHPGAASEHGGLSVPSTLCSRPEPQHGRLPISSPLRSATASSWAAVSSVGMGIDWTWRKAELDDRSEKSKNV